jgi:Flp pilus assembly protein TadG
MTIRKAPWTRIRRFFAADAASVMVEFAFLAPPLVLFLFGMIEFSRYAYTQSALNFAAEEATRFAVVNGGEVTNDEVLDLARDNLLFLDSGLAALCILSPTDATTQTSTVSVIISYDYDPIFPLVFGDIALEGRSEGYISFSPVDEGNDDAGSCGA